MLIEPLYYSRGVISPKHNMSNSGSIFMDELKQESIFPTENFAKNIQKLVSPYIVYK